MRIAMIGLLFMALSLAANILVLIPLIGLSTNKVESRKRNRTISIMLVNVPVAVFYVWLAFVLTNTIRVKFINKSGSILTNIHVLGCEEFEINDLKVNESTTIWIDIPSDCSVQVKYELHGRSFEQNVFGYATSGSGQAGTFRLGVDSLAIDERPGY